MTAQNKIDAAAARPCSIDAEQALLGALIQNGDALTHVTGVVAAEHFAEPLHGHIFAAINALAVAGKPITLALLSAELTSLELPEGVSLRGYLARLAAEATTIINAPDYAAVVRDLAHRRDIIAAADALQAEARDMPLTMAPASALERFSETVRPILDADARSSCGYAGALAETILAEIDQVQAGTLKFETFTTGFEPLDGVTKYRPEEVIVTAGRPGCGKSIMCTAAARRIAQAGIGVLEFPLENGRDQALARHLADLTYSSDRPIYFRSILDRDLPAEHDRARIARAVGRLRDLPLIMDDSERITVARIAARVKQEKARLAARGVRLGVVMIDHLDYIDASDRYAGNRVNEIGEIMKGLKAIARREKVTVHLFCQLNRQVESRDDKRPQLADLRSSGDIEQVADVVNFLYREAYYATRERAYVANEPDAIAHYLKIKNDLQVVCAKVRTGPTKVVELWCEPGASFVSGRMR